MNVFQDSAHHVLKRLAIEAHSLHIRIYCNSCMRVNVSGVFAVEERDRTGV